MERIEIKASSSYEVIIERGILKISTQYIKPHTSGNKIFVITDSNVAPLYLDILVRGLKTERYEVYSHIIVAGEDSKSISTLSDILNIMASHHITRADTLIALGGGVVGDLCGFTAAIYMRGVKYIHIPTTLLAMVDSSVGGKTAINLETGKNLVGAFYQPALVLCDPSVLSTLPQNIFADGMAEVIKYGAIRSEEILDFVKSGELVDNIISSCIRIKRDVVSLDEFDKGERGILNFGHTIGHAIEKCSNHEISHGSAVAIGMIKIAKGACEMGMCERAVYEELLSLIKGQNLPTDCDFTVEELYSAALSDKKVKDSSITLVLPTCRGKCILKEVQTKELFKFLK